MTEDEIETIQGFLQDLENVGLIKFPNAEFFPLFLRIQQNAEIDYLVQIALLKVHDVREQLTPQQKQKFITDDEYHALEISSSVAQLRIQTEELTSFLKSIINPEKINPNVTMLGTYLSLVYDQLHYSKQQRGHMNKTLLVNVRNALNHNDYEMKLDSFTYDFKSGNPIKLDVKELLNLMRQQSTMTNESITYIKKLIKN